MPEVLTLSFTEEMKGFVTFGAADFEEGFERGEADGTDLMFHLTITASDVDRFLTDPEHAGEATGWVACERLGGRLPVDRGDFNLFVDTGDPPTTEMRYRLFFVSGDGTPMTLVGSKSVHDDPGFDVWSDTTTLYTSIHDGSVEPDTPTAPEPMAVGILRIHLTDFTKQLTTFRVRGGSLADNLGALSRVGALFLGKLWDVYGAAARTAVERSS